MSATNSDCVGNGERTDFALSNTFVHVPEGSSTAEALSDLISMSGKSFSWNVHCSGTRPYCVTVGLAHFPTN